MHAEKVARLVVLPFGKLVEIAYAQTFIAMHPSMSPEESWQQLINTVISMEQLPLNPTTWSSLAMLYKQLQ